MPIILASGSAIRAQLLRNAVVDFQVSVPADDEHALKQTLAANKTPPRDIARSLATHKARGISGQSPGALVLGCDQVLDFDGRLISKPQSREHALMQLKQMRGKQHTLWSAAVICVDSAPVWSHVGQVRLSMRKTSDTYLAAYVARNWASIRHSVGAYKLEEEGVRLFREIDGDYFNVLGMPLLEILNFLTSQGIVET